MSSFDTDINGEPCEVYYDFHAGDAGDYYQPPEPDSVEITSVIYKGVEVINLLDSDQIEHLEAKALEDVQDCHRSYLEDQGEYEMERRREERYGN